MAQIIDIHCLTNNNYDNIYIITDFDGGSAFKNIIEEVKKMTKVSSFFNIKQIENNGTQKTKFIDVLINEQNIILPIIIDLGKLNNIYNFIKQYTTIKFDHLKNTCNPSKTLLIMGNGPSLKDLNFHKIKDDIDTFGFNSAYRYWEKINWYPTYYANFDLVVSIDHKEQIKKLIDESDKNGIKKFFLRYCILKYYPELVINEKVVFYELYDIDKNNPYLKLDTLCTGSLATKFSFVMGYQQIYMLGVDVNYIEQIPESNLKNGILQIDKDPEKNNNYFFDDYQQKGDKYNIPNCVRVHMKSWIDIHNDLQQNNNYKNIKIINLSDISNIKFFDKNNISLLYDK